MLLCDFAESINGKLYIQGAGWNQLLAGQPAAIALAILLEIPWDETNQPHDIKVQLLNEDAEPVTPVGAPVPLLIEGKVEVGRPPGVKRGSTMNAPLAFKLNGIVLEPGSYRFDLSVGDVPIAVQSFTAQTGEG